MRAADSGKVAQVCKESPYSAVVGLRHIERGGVGYKQGYTTLEGLLFFPEKSNVTPFLDLRTHAFDNNDYAANAGVGFRIKPSHHSLLCGANAYYDFRSDGRCQFFFNQIGVGLEFLSRALDFRINGYFPLPEKKTDWNCDRHYSGGYIIDRKMHKVAFNGVHAEVGHGGALNNKISLYGAVGMYYYAESIYQNMTGGKARLKGMFGKRLALEASASYDPVFGLKIQGEVQLRFPFGTSTDSKGNKERQSVIRDEIIVLDEEDTWEWNY